MPTEGGSVRDALAPAVERLPELLYRGPAAHDRPLTAVSSGAPRVTGYDASTFEDGDLDWRDVVHPDDREDAWAAVRDVAAGEEYDATYRIRTADGAARWMRDRGERLADGTLAGYVEDVTRLKEREERLREELDETMERVSDGFFALDTDWTFTYVNEQAGEFLEHDPAEMIGENVWEAFPAAIGTGFQAEYERALDAQEPVTFTEYFEPLDAHFEVSAYPSATGLSVYFRDVTERVEREQQLERYEAIVETVWDGVYALDEDDRFTLANEAYCDLLDVEREEIIGERAGDVLGEGVTGEAKRFAEEMRAGERDSATISFTIETGDGEHRPLEARFGPFPNGGRVGVLRDVTERRERQRQLRHQRERLSDLVELYDVASDVSNAIVEQTDQSAVEDLVAERIADGPYAAAWVGRTSGGGVAEAASTGMADAGLDPESLAERATDGDEVRVVDVDADDSSAAAVPIGYEGGTYGVLVVVSHRQGAFEDAERTVLRRLGTTIGHAIAALGRRAALMSEQVVEVEYRSETLRERLDGVADANAAFRFERTVATGDGRYVRYVEVRGVEADDALAVFEEAAECERARVVTAGDGHASLEIVASRAPVTTAIADHGGRVTAVTVTPKEAVVEAEFPQAVDLRTVTDSLRDVVPDVELQAQRSETRDEAAAEARVDALGSLTERQHAAFESAYYGGYFEWPRDSTAEELAEAMGVAAPTFHQHLRAAERKLLGAYVE
ncbi:MAG: PAS domain S-box protein [Halarchaeum sp.]